MRKVAFNELEPGMLTTIGLIVRTGEAGTDRLFTNTAYIKFFDIHDSFYGQASRAVKDGSEFEVLHEIGTKEYLAVIQKLVSDRVDCARDAENDIDLLNAYRRGK